MLPAATRRLVGPIERLPPVPARPTSQPVTALATIRNIPLSIAAGPLTPEWARGQAPSRTHGPFLNQRDEPVSIDIFRPVKLVSLLWSRNALLPPRLMALLPMRSTAVPARGGSGLPPAVRGYRHRCWRQAGPSTNLSA